LAVVFQVIDFLPQSEYNWQEFADRYRPQVLRFQTPIHGREWCMNQYDRAKMSCPRVTPHPPHFPLGLLVNI